MSVPEYWTLSEIARWENWCTEEANRRLTRRFRRWVRRLVTLRKVRNERY